ncbi:MAG: tyrosine-type recombinase/integrase, partial [Actinomycetota bacterium]|nr:tyrosine-type recombinase/integrase [Actinomycetota bacterium]
FEGGHRTLRIVGKGNKPAIIPLVPRTARTIAWQSVSVQLARSCSAMMAAGLTGALPTGASARWRSGLDSARCTPHMLRAAFIMCALEAGVPLREVQIAARHADPRTTTVYDHRRQSFDRHAVYVVDAFVAGG